MSKYFPPVFESNAFHCIHCGVYSTQEWTSVLTQAPNSTFVRSALRRCECKQCNEISYWHGGKLIIPSSSTAPQPHEDLPESCKADYEEARNIVALSPKAAAALMRLVVQKLMQELGESGDNINNDIKSLVSKGLPPLVQMALDFCRVIGNNAVHPGEIDLNDSPEVAHQLFQMVNFIVDERIARPKQIQAMYNILPEGVRQAIDKRDGDQK